MLMVTLTVCIYTFMGQALAYLTASPQTAIIMASGIPDSISEGHLWPWYNLQSTLLTGGQDGMPGIHSDQGVSVVRSTCSVRSFCACRPLVCIQCVQRLRQALPRDASGLEMAQQVWLCMIFWLPPAQWS